MNYATGDVEKLSPEKQDWLNRFYELNGIATVESVFSIEGEYFLGDKITVIKTYLELNPSKPFRIWVIDNYTRLTQ